MCFLSFPLIFHFEASTFIQFIQEIKTFSLFSYKSFSSTTKTLKNINCKARRKFFLPRSKFSREKKRRKKCFEKKCYPSCKKVKNLDLSRKNFRVAMQNFGLDVLQGFSITAFSIIKNQTFNNKQCL